MVVAVCRGGLRRVSGTLFVQAGDHGAVADDEEGGRGARKRDGAEQEATLESAVTRPCRTSDVEVGLRSAASTSISDFHDVIFTLRCNWPICRAPALLLLLKTSNSAWSFRPYRLCQFNQFPLPLSSPDMKISNTNSIIRAPPPHPCRDHISN